MIKISIFGLLFFILSFFSGNKGLWVISQIALVFIVVVKKLFIEVKEHKKSSIFDLVLYVITMFCVMFMVVEDVRIGGSVKTEHEWIFIIAAVILVAVLAGVRVIEKCDVVSILIEGLVFGILIFSWIDVSNIEFDSSVLEHQEAVVDNKYTGGNYISSYYVHVENSLSDFSDFACDKKLYLSVENSDTVILEKHKGFWGLQWWSIKEK